MSRMYILHIDKLYCTDCWVAPIMSLIQPFRRLFQQIVMFPISQEISIVFSKKEVFEEIDLFLFVYNGVVKMASNLTVAQLKAELKKLGLDTTGLKKVLVDRLEAAKGDSKEVEKEPEQRTSKRKAEEEEEEPEEENESPKKKGRGASKKAKEEAKEEAKGEEDEEGEGEAVDMKEAPKPIKGSMSQNSNSEVCSERKAWTTMVHCWEDLILP
jgi:hypothetical protein